MNANVSLSAVAHTSSGARSGYTGKEAAAARDDFDRALGTGDRRNAAAGSLRHGSDKTDGAVEEARIAQGEDDAAKFPDTFWKLMPAGRKASTEELPADQQASVDADDATASATPVAPDGAEPASKPPAPQEVPAAARAAPDHAAAGAAADDSALPPGEAGKNAILPDITKGKSSPVDAGAQYRVAWQNAKAAENAVRARANPADTGQPDSARFETTARKPTIARPEASVVQPVKQETPVPQPARAGADPSAHSSAARQQAAPTVHLMDNGMETQQPRVTVLGGQNIVAPSVPSMPLGPTGQGVVAAIESAPEVRAMPSKDVAGVTQRQFGQHAGASTLKIQLQPAELGMVTARLTATGSQLAIEIQVDNSDAWQRLSNDSDRIVKALRALGYDIDKLTIQQPQQTGPTTGQQSAGSGREQAGTHAQTDGRHGDGRSGAGGNARHDDGRPRNGLETNSDLSDGGLYI